MKLPQLLAFCLVTTAVVFAPAVTALADGPPWQWLWVYAPCNFQVNERVDSLIALMGRAKKAGYNGMLVTDYKFGNLKDRPAWYYTNLERARKAAEDLGMELIPAVMPVGYSGSVLQHNPNLAAGIPVRGCPMVAKSGKATVADPANRLSNGGFEEAGGKKMPGWDWMDACDLRRHPIPHPIPPNAHNANGSIPGRVLTRPLLQLKDVLLPCRRGVPVGATGPRTP